jgi:hypothetical protein
MAEEGHEKGVRGWREAQNGSRLAEKRQRPEERGHESFIKG